MPATQLEKEAKRIRLDLSAVDYLRSGQAGKAKGLNKASFAPTAVLAMIDAVEAEG